MQRNTTPRLLFLVIVSSWFALPAMAQVGGSGTTNTIPRWTASTTLGNSSITDDGTAATAKKLNKVIMVDQQSGSDVGTQINNCVSNLPAGGGICHARGFGGSTVTWSTAATLGAANKPVTLLIDRATIFNVTVNTGGAVLTIYSGGAIIGEGGNSGSGGTNFGFVLQSGASISSVITNTPQNRTVYIRGVDITDLNTVAPSNALMYLDSAYDTTTIQDTIVGGAPGKSLLLKAAHGAGPINVINSSFGGNMPTGGYTASQPVVIQG